MPDPADSYRSFFGKMLQAAKTRDFFLYAIPIGIITLGWFIFRPSTLDNLRHFGSSLNGFTLNGAEYFSVGFAILGAVVMLMVALSFLPDVDRTRLAFMLELLGGCLGWVLGMFLSPTSQSEQQTFLNAKTAIVGILSGYVLSKLQTAFDKAVADGRIFNVAFLLYSLCFFIPVLLSGAAVYNVRAYQDMTVIITPGKGGDLATSTIDGKKHILLPSRRLQSLWRKQGFRTIRQLCGASTLPTKVTGQLIEAPESIGHRQSCLLMRKWML